MPSLLFRFFMLSFLSLSVAQAQDVFTVQTVMIADQKAVLASVESQDVTSARARIGGTVDQLMTDEGAYVKAGEVLALVTDDKLELEKQSIEARLAALEAEEKLAQTALDRVIKLRKTGAASQAKLDEARTTLDVVKKNLKAMDVQRDLILQREKEGAVLAPTNGRVLKVQTTTGQVVLNGEELVVIADENVILRLQVPERHARYLSLGDEVVAFVRKQGDETDSLSKGIISQIYPRMENGRFIADVRVEGLENHLIGERVRVLINTGLRKTILIPQTAVFSKYGLNYVRLGDGMDVVVQIGAAHDEKLEVLAGLKDGDAIMLGVAQ